MKTFSRFFILFSLLLPAAPGAAQERLVLRSIEQIPPLVERGNEDLKIIQQNIRRAHAVLEDLRGDLYSPNLKTEIGFEDNQRRPESNFQSARYRDFFWRTYTEQKFPVGLQFNAGLTYHKLDLFQSDPPNPLLPFPQTFHEPALFLQARLDLMQDLLGFTTKRNMELAGLEVEVNRLQKKLLRHKLTTTASALFLQIHSAHRMNSLTRAVIGELDALKNQIAQKQQRALAEPGDVFQVERLIASRVADLPGLRRTEEGLSRSLQNLLGLSSPISIQPKLDSRSLQASLNQCEQRILGNSPSHDSSDEMVLLEKERSKAGLRGELHQRRRLPQMVLQGSITSTGTDERIGKSYQDLASWDRPIYQIGLELAWPLSPKKIRAAKELSEVENRIAELESSKLIRERQNLWKEAQRKIRFLRTEQAALRKGIGSGEKETQDLKNRYAQGRMTLFQLTQAEIELLQLKIREESLIQERIGLIYQTLQYFNKIECPLIPHSALN